jgi:acyl-CoA reductase-like NAD-dependent aldehyde dehydrogenase
MSSLWRPNDMTDTTAHIVKVAFEDSFMSLTVTNMTTGETVMELVTDDRGQVSAFTDDVSTATNKARQALL